MVSSRVAPFLIGFVAAPLAAKVVKPVARGVIKAGIGLAFEVRSIAAQVGEEFQDIAAEAAAEAISENGLSGGAPGKGKATAGGAAR
jgi:hypothetical protein